MEVQVIKKLTTALLSAMAIAAVAGVTMETGAARAAAPAPVCAKEGQPLAKGTNRYNTALVKLWVFDKNNQPWNTGGFSLVRIGKNNKHIPVAGLAIPNCWTLFSKLPNFGKKPMTLCVVVHDYRAMPDPAYPNRPAACPTPVFDRTSGLYTYKAFLQKV
jgi:hypothetical protein